MDCSDVEHNQDEHEEVVFANPVLRRGRARSQASIRGQAQSRTQSVESAKSCREDVSYCLGFESDYARGQSKRGRASVAGSTVVPWHRFQRELPFAQLQSQSIIASETREGSEPSDGNEGCSPSFLPCNETSCENGGALLPVGGVAGHAKANDDASNTVGKSEDHDLSNDSREMSPPSRDNSSGTIGGFNIRDDEGTDDFEKGVLPRQISVGTSSLHAMNRDRLAGMFIDSMTDDINDVATQTKCLRSLRNLAIDASRRELIGASGGIRAAVDALEKHSSNLMIQELGTRFLADVCNDSPSNRQQVGHTGGIEAIIGAMQDCRFPSEKVIASCCYALQMCCGCCGANQVLAGVSGAIEMILKAMRRTKSNASLQKQCLAALHALASQNYENQSLIREAGGAQEILSCFRHFPDECSIQKEALAVTLVMSEGHCQFRESTGKAGIIADIAAALKAHSDSQDVVTTGSGCLRFLAFEQYNRTIMGGGAVVTVLIELLEKWRASESTVKNILLALSNATFDDPLSKSLAAKNGGINAIVNAMDTHRLSTSIVEFSCRVLRNISDGRQSGKRACQKHNAVQMVVLMMKDHLGAPGVQEHGCAMLINMMTLSHVGKGARLEQHLDLAMEMHRDNGSALQQIEHLRNDLANVRRSGSLAHLLRRGSSHTLTNAADVAVPQRTAAIGITDSVPARARSRLGLAAGNSGNALRSMDSGVSIASSLGDGITTTAPIAATKLEARRGSATVSGPLTDAIIGGQAVEDMLEGLSRGGSNGSSVEY